VWEGTLGSQRRRVVGSAVELEISALSDVPPPTERTRLEHSLRKQYPDSGGAPVLVYAEWSAPGRFWTIRMASQRVASARFVDCTHEVADRLLAAGLATRAERYPLDSPPDGVVPPRRS